MGYIYKNENPYNNMDEDCIIRAIATATGRSWDDIFVELTVEAYMFKRIINSNMVWGSYLENNGFIKRNIPCTDLMCVTVRDFAEAHKTGTFVLGDGSHAIACVDGNYIDTFDSGDRTVLFYYEKEN